MFSFDFVVEHLFGLEKGYSNNKYDRGGKTKWGITEAVAREWGYAGKMDELPPDTARQIYRNWYWDKCKIDEVRALAPMTAFVTFDTAVNSGAGRAGEYLQRTVNYFLPLGREKIPVDFGIGPITLTAMADAIVTLRAREEYPTEADYLFMQKMTAFRNVLYEMKVAEDSTQKEFVPGWDRRSLNVMLTAMRLYDAWEENRNYV